MSFLAIHSNSSTAPNLRRAVVPRWHTWPLYRRSTRTRVTGLVASAVLWPLVSAFSAPITNLFSAPLAPSLPDTGPSLLRVLGALALVLGLFLGGVWFVRNGRFSTLGRSRSAKLNVLETRSLGARQAICVVAYGSERFLVGSTPAGIHLISHLSADTAAESGLPSQPATNLSFGQALAQVLRGPVKTAGKV